MELTVSVPSSSELKEARMVADMTQSDLADKAGCSQGMIARIEGDDVSPRLETVRAIVDALNDEL